MVGVASSDGGNHCVAGSITPRTTSGSTAQEITSGKKTCCSQGHRTTEVRQEEMAKTCIDF